MTIFLINCEKYKSCYQLLHSMSNASMTVAVFAVLVDGMI